MNRPAFKSNETIGRGQHGSCSTGADLNALRSPAPTSGRGSQDGFTLIELIVVIVVLSVLAAIAVPIYIDLGREARLASLKSLTGTLWTAANNVHLMCGLTPPCDYENYSQNNLIIDNRFASVDYGWPNAGDGLNNGQIDAWITYEGFTASLPLWSQTKFSKDDAPDPDNCAVVYEEATFHPDRIPTITSSTSGC